MMAYAVAALALYNAWSLSRHAVERVRRSARLVAGAVLVQMALGIATLLAAVPLWLGLLHQAGAAIVFVLAIRHWFLITRSRETQPPVESSIVGDAL